MRDIRLIGIGLLFALRVIGKYGGFALAILIPLAALIFGLGLLWRGWFHHTSDAFIWAGLTVIIVPIAVVAILAGLHDLGAKRVEGRL